MKRVDDKTRKVYKLGLDIFEDLSEVCHEQLNVAHHALSFYLLEKSEFIDTIALLSDILTVNYRMIKELERLEQSSKIKDRYIYLTDDQITLLEAATLSKLYAIDELEKSCLVSVYYN